jgi:hypothetical protein
MISQHNVQAGGIRVDERVPHRAERSPHAQRATSATRTRPWWGRAHHRPSRNRRQARPTPTGWGSAAVSRRQRSVSGSFPDGHPSARRAAGRYAPVDCRAATESEYDFGLSSVPSAVLRGGVYDPPRRSADEAQRPSWYAGRGRGPEAAPAARPCGPQDTTTPEARCVGQRPSPDPPGRGPGGGPAPPQRPLARHRRDRRPRGLGEGIGARRPAHRARLRGAGRDRTGPPGAGGGPPLTRCATGASRPLPWRSTSPRAPPSSVPGSGPRARGRGRATPHTPAAIAALPTTGQEPRHGVMLPHSGFHLR